MLESELIFKHELLVAYKVREARQHFIINKYKLDKKINIQLLWAFVCQKDFKNAVDVCARLRKKAIFRINKDKFGFLAKLIENNRFDAEDLPKRFNLGIDKKDVFVYGPLFDADSFYQNATNVTIGYKGNTDKKVNISFYNAEASSKICSLDSKSFFNDLDYAVFFKKKHKYQKQLIKKGLFRYIFTIDFIFEMGQPNLLQNMVFHLLRNKPNSLFLSGFNLYLSKNIYGKNYNDYKNTSGRIDEVRDAFAQHNIISQYQFLDFLYSLGHFSCDKRLDYVLNLGIKGYLAKMEQLLEGDSYGKRKAI